jgi:uncharacterized protein involved in tolerance to divalent cations
LHQEDKILFTILKKEIVAAMKQSYPGMNPEISDWKGQEITDFQEDLLIKVNGRLSEKWFYSHMKTSNQSLPRIDVLNMLSKYAGYSNWNDFRFKNSEQIPLADKLKKTNSVFYKIPLVLLVIMILFLVLYKIINTQNYRFTFIDADTGETIVNSNIQIDLLQKGESPVNYKCEKDGSFILRTDQSRIKMVIRSPYYLVDTVERILKKFNRDEQIRLHADAYALMLRYFSNTDVKAWQKRREQLDKMINDGAIICQVPDPKEGNGIELFNKWEFIDKLTMPTSSLRQIEILDSRYENGRIAILRFKVKMNIR